MIGARSIAQRSKQLEAVARRGDLNASSQLLGDLDSYVTRVVSQSSHLVGESHLPRSVRPIPDHLAGLTA